MIKITRSIIRNKVLMLMLAMLALVKVNAWAINQVDGVYQISSAQDLRDFAALVNGGTTDAKAVLTQDIDLDCANNGDFPGICVDGSTIYTGTFDGQGHKIDNFKMSFTSGNARHKGLFGYVKNATIKNFSISGDMTFNCTQDSYFNGAVVGRAEGNTSFEDITSSVNITVKDNQCRHIGGIVGVSMANTVTFNRCRYSGSIIVEKARSFANAQSVGGIVGEARGVKLTNCLFDGALTTKADGCIAGGLLGDITNNSTINNSMSHGTFNIYENDTKGYVSQFIGMVFAYKDGAIVTGTASATIKDCYYTGSTQLYTNADPAKMTVTNVDQKTDGVSWTTVLGRLGSSNWHHDNTLGYPIPGASTLYTVTYYVDGVQYGEPQSYAADVTITPPTPPTKVGYVFDHWENLPATMPANNITVNAVFAEHVHNYAESNGFCTAIGTCGEVYQPITPNEEGVYEITNGGQLFWFANSFNSESIPLASKAVLTTNINLENKNFPGIGVTSSKCYAGTFDGQGHTISSFYQQKADYRTGMFSTIKGTSATNKAIVKNFTLEGKKDVNTASGMQGSVAGEVGANALLEDVISKVNITNSVAGTLEGGLVGCVNAGTVNRCTYSGSIDCGTATNSIGGIAGVMRSGTISNCLFNGTITNTNATPTIGGIVGTTSTSNGSTITNCLVNGTITVANYAGNASGIVFGTAANSLSINVTYYTTNNVSNTLTAAVGNTTNVTGTPTEVTENWDVICGNLNNHSATKSNWEIGTSGYPIPKIVDASHEHTWNENGFCTSNDGAYNEVGDPVDDYYQITNGGMLLDFANKIKDGTVLNSCNAQLTTNVNLANVEFPGIGEYSADASKAYSGTFDGQGFTISGYNRKVTSGNQQGFFNYAKGATIKNFKLEGTMTDSGTGQQHGSVIGWADEGTLIEDVHSSVNVTISGTAQQVGGFVGRAGGTFNRCSYSGTVSTNTAYDKIGGFAGSLRAGTIKNCLFDGQLNISTNNESLKAGGFAGAVIEIASSMSNSLVNGTIDISNKTDNCGVTVGLVDKNTTFTMVLYTTANTNGLTSAVGSVSSNYTLTGTAKDVTSETWTKVNVMLNPSEGTTGNWKIKTGDGDKAYPVPMLVNDFSHTHTYKNGFCIADDGSYEAAEKDILDGYYKVTNAGNLWWLMQQINSTDKGTLANNVHIKLINDIDMEGQSHGNFPGICPLGKNASNQDDWNNTAFKGIFDGKGHSINNYYRNIASGARLGLINCADSATIKNFDISGQMIAGAGSTEAALVGVVVGVARGTTAIEDIESHVTITANRVRGLGGIAGCLETSNNQATVTMNRCLYDGTITVSGTGNSGIGGVCGELRSAVIKNSMFDGTISLGGDVGYKYVGGIAGVVQNNSNSEIRRVFMHGRLSLANITTNSVQESGNNKLVTGSQSGLVVGCVKKTLYMEKCFHVKESTGLQDAIGVQFDTESTGTGDDKVTTETIVNYLILGTSTDITTSATILNQKNVEMYDEYFHTTLGKSNWQISSYTSGNYPKPKRDPDHIHQYSNGFCTSGDGEYERPTKMGNAYQIDNGGKLYWFAEQFNAKKINKDVTVEIMNNIDMEGDKYTYPGIGVEGWRFSGTFNGHGNTIRKYRRDIVNAECTGLINYSEKNAVIRNFTINGDVYFNLSVIKSFHGTVLGMGVPSTDKGYEGDLMLIEDVTSNVNVWIQNSYTRVLGGIAGRACGTINRCRYSGNIGKSVDNSSKLVHMESGRQIGGICANAISRIDITNCLFDGKIACRSVADTMRVCGILASNEKSTNVDIKIEKCLFNGCLDLIHAYTGDNKSTENGIIAGYWDTQKASLIDNVYYIADCTTDGLTVGNWKTDPKTNNTTKYESEPTQDEWVSIKNSLNSGCEPDQENWIIDDSNESIPNANVCKHITDVKHPELYFNEFGWCTICGDRRPIGQEEDGTYKIEYLSDLATFRDKVNSGNSTSTTIYNAKLVNDLDFENFDGELGQPIGNSFYNRYLYNFDGQGYTIKNIRVTSDQQFVGLFGYAGDTEHDCYIHDFTITGYIDVPYESSKNEEQPLYAGVVGKMFRGKIENVHSQMTIGNSKVTEIVLGGILGSSESEDASNQVIVSKCSYIGAATVNAYGSMGGIVGRTSANTLVRDCTFAGSLTSNYEGDIQMTSFGGVVGYNEATTFQGVRNCVIAGAMTTKTTNFKEYGEAGNHKNILCGEDKVITDGSSDEYRNRYSNNYALNDYKPLIPTNTLVNPNYVYAADFASGKVCALLNANDNFPSEVQNGYPWGQILGYQFGTGEHSRTAGSPAQRVPFPGYNNPDKTVYKVTATANAQNSSKKDYVFDYFYFDDADDASPLMPDDAAGMKVKRVQYTRAAATMTSGYISVCLPFALPDDLLPGGSDCEVKVYKDFISDGSTNKVNFRNAADEDRYSNSMYQAGVPYFFYLPESVRNKVWNIDHNYPAGIPMVNSPVNPSDVGIMGSFSKIVTGAWSSTSRTYKLNADGNKLLRTTASSHCYPYRGYVKLPATASAKEYQLFFDDEASGIGNVTVETIPDGPRYNVMGQRVTNNAKGVVIVNGRKYLQR